jgi:hypothetical protein
MESAHILAEIRRTTAENGGTPLGRLRFRNETGIRERDWMKYWPRWADAIRAAGLEPTNQFNAAYPESRLLEQLAGLTRELGKFPVTGEMRVKARADKNFPSQETYRRLGGMRVIAEKLRAFANQRGYEDVAALCPVAVSPSVDASPAKREASIQIGSVYLMRSGKFFKIGHSNAVGRRERELAIQLPDKLKLIHEIRTDDPVGIEGYWHRRFAERHRNGEWFDLTPDDVAAFRRRKTM